MEKSEKSGSKRGVAVAVGAGVVLVALAFGLPAVFASFFSGREMPIEERAGAVREQMDSARRAYEAEADVSVPRGVAAEGSRIVRDGEPVTPAEVAPKIVGRVDVAGIVAVWLEAPSFAPGPIEFDRSRDSMSLTFVGTGDRRGVPLSDLFTGGAWSIRPGGRSAEHRTTAPAGFKGDVEIEFVHVSAAGGRTVVTERVRVN